jgi:hypothetical protein
MSRDEIPGVPEPTSEGPDDVGDEAGTPAIPAARRRVTLRGSAGKPIMFAHVENGVLFVDVESYAGPTDPGGPDIEFMAQIAGEQFPGICHRFDIDPALSILDALQAVSDSGQGPAFVAALHAGDIQTTSRFVWWSFDD